MARRIEVRTGVTGYRDQLDIVRRYLDRVLTQGRKYPYVIDYQDDVWSFFQNCWHLKDWVKNDPLVPQEVKDRVVAAAESSNGILAVANDMANVAKHLKLHDPEANAAHAFTRIAASGPESLIECMIEVDGRRRPASEVAQECVVEWEKILQAEKLSVEPIGA
jgi:hypothetical protein